MAWAPGGADRRDQSPEVAAGQRLARPPLDPLAARLLGPANAPSHPPLRPDSAATSGCGGKARLQPAVLLGEDLGASCPRAALGLSARERPLAVLGGKVQGGKSTLYSECHSPTRSRLAPAPGPRTLTDSHLSRLPSLTTRKATPWSWLFSRQHCSVFTISSLLLFPCTRPQVSPIPTLLIWMQTNSKARPRSMAGRCGLGQSPRLSL